MTASALPPPATISPTTASAFSQPRLGYTMTRRSVGGKPFGAHFAGPILNRAWGAASIIGWLLQDHGADHDHLCQVRQHCPDDLPDGEKLRLPGPLLKWV